MPLPSLIGEVGNSRENITLMKLNGMFGRLKVHGCRFRYRFQACCPSSHKPVGGGGEADAHLDRSAAARMGEFGPLDRARIRGAYRSGSRVLVCEPQPFGSAARNSPVDAELVWRFAGRYFGASTGLPAAPLRLL